MNGALTEMSVVYCGHLYLISSPEIAHIFRLPHAVAFLWGDKPIALHLVPGNPIQYYIYGILGVQENNLLLQVQ